MTTQPPQASASTNSAIRANDVDTDAVSQKNGASSSDEPVREKFHESPVGKESQQRSLRNQIAHIYMVQCEGPGGPVKIGQAVDPPRRVSELQIGCPYALVLLASWPSADADTEERTLHEQFRKRRIRGEWFRPSETMLALARQARMSQAAGILLLIKGR